MHNVDYTDGTHTVDVWSDEKHTWMATLPKDIVCMECGSRNDIYDDTVSDPVWWWDQTIDRKDMLVCGCGMQYFLTIDRED